MGEIIGFDCGTTNWRLYRLGYTESDGVRQPVGQPQRMALSVFKESHLPAALLLDGTGAVSHYGENAYREACGDPELRAGLRDAFKLCIGNREALDALQPRRRFSHDQALEYTRLLLAQVVERLGVERPGSLDGTNLFYFAHPVHWGREVEDGGIEGELLAEFAKMVRSCFPEAVRERVHFVPEPEAALLNLAHSGQVKQDRMTLVVDVGGGTTDLAVGLWTREGLRESRTGGGPHGSNLYDHDLAKLVADRLNIPDEQRAMLWAELCEQGKQLKENLSRQIAINPNQPATTLNVTVPMLDGPPYYGKVKLDRATFEQVTRATSADFNELVMKSLIRKMDLRVSDIQQVVLVGGGANLYRVPQLLNELFEAKAPVTYASPPEEAIVSGTVWRAVFTVKEDKPQPDPELEEKAGAAQELRITLHTTYQCTKDANGVAFSPDSCLLAAACGGSRNLFNGRDDAVWIWKTGGQGLIHKLTGYPNWVESVAFSPDGQWLASASMENILRLWRVVDGTLLRTLSGHTEQLVSVAFSPDGQWLASSSYDKTVRVWRVADGAHLRSLTGHTSPVSSVAFSPDGQWLASGSCDNTVRLWRVKDGTCAQTLTGHKINVNSVDFSPDGQWLASGSCDNTVRLWRVKDGTCAQTLTGHTNYVHSVAFSPNGQWLVSGAWDNTVRLWRAADGAPMHTLTGHTNKVNSVTFSPDGQWLASGSNDKTVRLWKIEQA